MSITDIGVAVVILSVISLAIWKIRRDKKKGTACCGCSGCPAAESCGNSEAK